MNDCDHALAGLLPEPDGTLAIMEFDYCPKCGEKLLTERNTESEVLAVIHAYDETAESKLSRIWKILGEKA